MSFSGSFFNVSADLNNVISHKEFPPQMIMNYDDLENNYRDLIINVSLVTKEK